MSIWAQMSIIIIVVACPDQGVGNDPEALGLAFHQPRFCKFLSVKLTSLQTAGNTG